MNKTILIVTAVMLAISACHTSRTMSTPTPGETELATAKTRFPDVSLEQLQQGHTLFYGACTDCHKAKNIKGYNETELSEILDKMAKKAELSKTQHEAVWRYMITVRLAAK